MNVQETKQFVIGQALGGEQSLLFLARVNPDAIEDSRIGQLTASLAFLGEQREDDDTLDRLFVLALFTLGLGLPRELAVFDRPLTDDPRDLAITEMSRQTLELVSNWTGAGARLSGGGHQDSQRFSL